LNFGLGFGFFFHVIEFDREAGLCRVDNEEETERTEQREKHDAPRRSGAKM
jgi:hypothetical protein